MAGSVNKVLIVGNLGRDPEVRSLQNGGKVCNLSVATSESWRDKQTGERKERVEWHRIVVWNEPLIDIAEQYLRKGAKVYIEGQLETRKYTDQSGVEKYTTEVVLRPFRGQITMLGGGERDDDAAEERHDTSAGARRYADASGSSGRGRSSELDDDIPF